MSDRKARTLRSLQTLLILLTPGWSVAGPISLRSITTAATPARITLRLSDPISAHASAVGAVDGAPHRIAIDLPGTVLDRDFRLPATPPPPVTRIRVGAHDGERVRVVIDLDHSTPFNLSSEGANVTIVLSGEVATELDSPQTTGPTKVAGTAKPEPASAPRSADDWLRHRIDRSPFLTYDLGEFRPAAR